jgi:hypothetical protein
MAISMNGVEQEQDLEGVYYTPKVHMQLVLLGKLEGPGWHRSTCEDTI